MRNIASYLSSCKADRYSDLDSESDSFICDSDEEKPREKRVKKKEKTTKKIKNPRTKIEKNSKNATNESAKKPLKRIRRMASSSDELFGSDSDSKKSKGAGEESSSDNSNDFIVSDSEHSLHSNSDLPSESVLSSSSSDADGEETDEEEFRRKFLEGSDKPTAVMETLSGEDCFNRYSEYITLSLLSPTLSIDDKSIKPIVDENYPNEYFTHALYRIQSSLLNKARSEYESSIWSKEYQNMLLQFSSSQRVREYSYSACAACSKLGKNYTMELFGAPLDIRELWKGNYFPWIISRRAVWPGKDIFSNTTYKERLLKEVAKYNQFVDEVIVSHFDRNNPTVLGDNLKKLDLSLLQETKAKKQSKHHEEDSEEDQPKRKRIKQHIKSPPIDISSMYKVQDFDNAYPELTSMAVNEVLTGEMVTPSDVKEFAKRNGVNWLDAITIYKRRFCRHLILKFYCGHRCSTRTMFYRFCYVFITQMLDRIHKFILTLPREIRANVVECAKCVAHSPVVKALYTEFDELMSGKLSYAEEIEVTI